jgi:hypothetical protein
MQECCNLCITFRELKSPRSIARILRQIFPIEINYQLIIYWIKKLGIAEEEKAAALSNSKVIPILELDELYPYIQKKQIRSEYGCCR